MKDKESKGDEMNTVKITAKEKLEVGDLVTVDGKKAKSITVCEGNCDHMIGARYEPYEGADIVRVSDEDIPDWRDEGSVDIFNYCPLCGKTLTNVPKSKRVPTKETEPDTIEKEGKENSKEYYIQLCREYDGFLSGLYDWTNDDISGRIETFWNGLPERVKKILED